MTSPFTTLNKIKACHPCKEGWQKLLTYLGKTQADDEPLSFLTILESNGFDDTLWSLRAAPEYNSLWRHFAVDCTESVKHLMKDERSLAALEIARKFADGLVTEEELKEAKRRAADAVADAVAYAAAYAVAYAAYAAAYAVAYAAADAVAYAVAYAARQQHKQKLTQRLAFLLAQGCYTPWVQE